MTQSPLIDVKNLKVSFATAKGPVEAVRGISFTLGRERLGIVGESGSGKSQTGRAILQLLDRNGTITADRLAFQDMDLLAASRSQIRAIRGQCISMVMQDPRYSLNPVMTVGRQVSEAFLAHSKSSRADAKRKAIDMLERVKIRNPKAVYDLYPHQVSGGMGQRIMIAMMLIPNPNVVIADEPTSALDVTVQMQVLALMDEMITQRGMGLILISHDLKLVANFCDRIIVMRHGQIVETLEAARLEQAQHPYTQQLLKSAPNLLAKQPFLPVACAAQTAKTSP